MAKKADGKIILLLEMKDGSKKKVTIPANWKVTFGALVPGSKEHSQNSGSATALRLYEGATQKAVFTGVESFRDMSIGIEEEVSQTQEEEFFKEDEQGNKKAFTMKAEVKQWINPDAPKPVRPAGTDLLRIPQQMREIS